MLHKPLHKACTKQRSKPAQNAQRPKGFCTKLHTRPGHRYYVPTSPKAWAWLEVRSCRFRLAAR
jgi:hypothetical protein